MAKVMLVDAAFSAIPIYQELIRQGHDVVTVGSRTSDPLVSIGINHQLIDYSDTGALARVAYTQNIDYVVPGCTDVSYNSCIVLNENGGFPGLDTPRVHATLHNKQLFRAFLKKNRLSTPRMFEMDDALVRGPVIVKPVDAFSGKGITHLPSPTQETLAAAYRLACSNSTSGDAVIEEFVDGQLYSHSAFLKDQKILSDHFVVEHCSTSPYAVDISHVDNTIPEAVISSIRYEIEKIAKLLQLTDGLLHTQFICNGKQFWFIETTRRCPGDLYSQLIEFSGALNYTRNYTAAFVGDTTVPRPHNSDIFILRQTIKAHSNTPFTWLNFNHSTRLKALVPLASPGQSMQAFESRQAIAFYQCETLNELKNLASEIADFNSTVLLNRTTESAHYNA